MKSFYFDLFYQILFHDCNQYALELRCLCHGWSNLCVRCVENYILQSRYNMFTSVHMKAKGGRKGGSYPNGILSMSSLRDIHFPRKIARKFPPPSRENTIFFPFPYKKLLILRKNLVTGTLGTNAPCRIPRSLY